MALTLVFILLQIIINTCSFTSAATDSDFSSILVFGDSTVDTGNNNFIPTIFRANFVPYGQNFPGQKPTGRFSNGKLVPDFVADSLGIKQTVPPALDPNLSDDELLTGVAFASAGSGYDDITTLPTGVIPFSKQLEYFKNYTAKLGRIVGVRRAKKVIKNALVIISSGTNDIAISYYVLGSRRAQYDINSYQDYLLKLLQNYVKELYNRGCRKMVIAGLPPMGCLPILITARLKLPFDRTCVEEDNADARSYNQKLENLLAQLQESLPRSKIVYSDIYTPFMELIKHPQKYGFKNIDKGCCGIGIVETSLLCNFLTPVCAKPSEFLFWDSIHPSERAYKFVADFLVDQISPVLV